MSNIDSERTNSADPDQTAPKGRSSLIWVCTVCSGASAPFLRKIVLIILAVLLERYLM